MAVYLGSLELVCFWLVIWAELSTPSQMSLLCNFTVVITCPEVKALWHNRSGSAPHPLLVSSKLSTLDLVSLLFCTSKQNERVTIDKGFSSLMASGSRWWMGPGVDCGEFQSIYYSQYLPFIGTAHLGLLWPDFLWDSRKPGVCMKLMCLNFWQQIQNLIKIAWAKQSTSARHPSMEFSRQEYWSGLPFSSPGIFLTQGSKPGLPHCRQTLYRLSHQGSPFKSHALFWFP